MNCWSSGFVLGLSSQGTTGILGGSVPAGSVPAGDGLYVSRDRTSVGPVTMD